YMFSAYASVFSSLYFICLIHIFFFHHPPTIEIYTLSLHDALPIWSWSRMQSAYHPSPSLNNTIKQRNRTYVRVNFMCLSVLYGHPIIQLQHNIWCHINFTNTIYCFLSSILP